MECQKIMNLVDNTTNQPSKFTTKYLCKVSDDIRRAQPNSQIKFKNSPLKLSLCDYSDAYILASRTIIITRTQNDAAARQKNERKKEVIFTSYASFTDCISKKNNT